VALGFTATETGPTPAGKGEPETGVRVPLEPMLWAETFLLLEFTT
jgi:hypothetical protein